MKTQSILVLGFVVMMLAVGPTSAQIRYTIIDLGTLGGSESHAESINDRGQIVGYARNSSEVDRATLFDPTGDEDNIDLGTLGGQWSRAYSINSHGHIVGDATNNSYWRATLFDPSDDANNIDLGTLGGDHSWARCINDNGQIVGAADTQSSYDHATMFDPTGRGNNIDLGTLGGHYSKAESINDIGQIVGYAERSPGYNRAALFDPTYGGNNTNLGTLGGSYSFANAINDAGQIVGRAYNRSGYSRATLYDPSGSGNNRDLGTLGGMWSVAYSINDGGQIVGKAALASGYTHATLFGPTRGSSNIDLHTLIDPSSEWTLYYARSINNHGWIVGTGRNPDGATHAFLMKPAPEPVIEAEIDIGPHTLNLSSKGKWITCHIWLPEDYNVADVNSYSVFLEDEIGAEWIWVDEEKQVVMAKFNRSDVCRMLELGDVELAVSGELIDGTRFEGTDTIKVIDKGRTENHKPKP